MDAKNKEDIKTSSSKNAKWYVIDKKMLPSKLGYFFYFSAWGCYLPFVNIFLVSTGLSYKEAGFISGVCYAFQAIACPLWGFAADATGQRKLVFTLLCVGSALIVCSQPVVAWKINDDNQRNCLQNSSALNNNMTRHIFGSLTTTSVNLSGTHISGSENEVNTMPIRDCSADLVPFSSTLFSAMLILFMLEQCLTGPLVSTLDSVVMNVVTNSDDPSSFGIQRVFGSIGFGICSFVSGVVVDNYYPEETSLSRYTPVFFMPIPLFLGLYVVGIILHNQAKWGEDSTTNDEEGNPMLGEKTEPNQLAEVWNALYNTRNIFFFTTVLIAGISFSVYWSFIFLLLHDAMNATKTAMGLTSFTSSISEIFMFPFTGKIVKFFGPLVCMELGIVAFVIRLTLLSFMENAWASIPVQVLHSISFALLWAAAVKFVQIISTENIYSTMFGVLCAIMFGLASTIGNMMGGFFYHSYGGRALFKGTAMFAGAWAIVMILCLHVFRCIDSNVTEPTTDDDDSSIKKSNGKIDGSEMMKLVEKA